MIEVGPLLRWPLRLLTRVAAGAAPALVVRAFDGHLDRRIRARVGLERESS